MDPQSFQSVCNYMWFILHARNGSDTHGDILPSVFPHGAVYGRVQNDNPSCFDLLCVVSMYSHWKSFSVLSVFYSLQMWDPLLLKKDELCYVKQSTTTWCVECIWISFKLMSPDHLANMSDLFQPRNTRRMCWTGLSTRTVPDVPANGNARCSFGAQVSPHLLSSCWHIGGLLPLKGFMFGHMVLHFHLFWQPNMNYQPISALHWEQKQQRKKKEKKTKATIKLFRLCWFTLDEQSHWKN